MVEILSGRWTVWRFGFVLGRPIEWWNEKTNRMEVSRYLTVYAFWWQWSTEFIRHIGEGD